MNPDALIYLVGNKNDITDRKVAINEIETIKDLLSLRNYTVISAKSRSLIYDPMKMFLDTPHQSSITIIE